MDYNFNFPKKLNNVSIIKELIEVPKHKSKHNDEIFIGFLIALLCKNEIGGYL